MGVSDIFACDTASRCTVTYGIAYTPQVHRIYPSTVYAGQDICFNVFTDYAAANDRSLYLSAAIGEYSMEFDTYDDNNVAEKSTWDDYQICGTAGGNEAKASNDLTIISGTGKYLVTDFAKSYDGTNEYVIRTIPSVTEVSASTLYKAPGGILTIKGEGFDVTSSNNEVKVDDVTCTVFEATSSHLRCSLAEKSTTTSATNFVGGIGARVKEYSGYSDVSKIPDLNSPTSTLYYTDIESRRYTDDEDNSLVRTLEYWFVPPQTGGYIFHASCDNSCSVEMSTTDMDPSAASSIISVSWNAWRNFWDPSPASISSSEMSLEAGKHYYMKVTHSETSGFDYVTVGFTINDASTSHANSEKGWKSIYIEPHHTFEKYEILLPNNTEAGFRLQFSKSGKNCTGVSTSSDVFQCTEELCPCVSSTFKASHTTAEFKNSIKAYFNLIKSNYGNYMSVLKETLDANGVVTATASEIENYKFTVTFTYVLSSPSSTEVKIYSKANGVSGTVSKTQDSTVPLSGNYRIRIPLTNGTNVDTEDIPLSNYNGHITRSIYKASPEYIGKIELKTVYSKYPSSNEGKQLYYRISGHPSKDLQIIDSPDNPLAGGSTTQSIETLANASVKAASNTPFYEVIPGPMVRAYESSPQIVVTSNNIKGACPITGTCDVSFIDDVGEISSRTASHPYASMTFVGTNLPASEITYVSVGTVRRCDIKPSVTITPTGLECTMSNMIAGTHDVVVQSSKGAIKNAASVTSLDVDIIISSVTPPQLHSSGGQTVTITGQFFPQSLSEANSFADFKVSFTGGEICTVTSVTSTTIICTSPPNLSGSTSLKVAFNGKSKQHASAFTITQSNESVSSVDKTIICPVLKQDLVITVSSLPNNNADDYIAILANSDTTIKMRVNSIDTGAKTLTARFPGSPKNAEYYLYVENNNTGERYKSSIKVKASSQIDSYQITTTLPTAKSDISTTGGDTIKITGSGFSTTLSDNIVQFGDAYATVLSATETELIVRAGSSSVTGSVEIKVFLKLSIESICAIGGGCTISYSSVGVPQLTNPTTVLTPVNGVVTISGSNFGANPVGYIGTYAQVTVSSSTTEVQIKLTKFDDNEVFELEIRTDTINLPTVVISQPLQPSLTSVSPHVGSSGGEKLILSTYGLGLSTTSNLNVFYGSGVNAVSVCDSVSLVDSSTVTCITKKDLEITKNALKLSYTHKSSLNGKVTTVTLSCATSTNCEYETAVGSTPSITNIAKSNSDKTLTLTVSGFSIDNTYTAKVYYGNLMVTSESITSSTEITAIFSNGLPPGAVSVRISFEKGDRITYTAGSQETIALSASMNSPTSCSWAGGCLLEVNQASIKEGATAGDIKVKVCGNEATLLTTQSTQDQIVLWAPHYSTTHSLDTYMVEQAKLITGTVTSLPVSDGVLAFDGITSTMFVSYTSNN